MRASFRKFVAQLLVVAMLIGMLPVYALADVIDVSNSVSLRAIVDPTYVHHYKFYAGTGMVGAACAA